MAQLDNATDSDSGEREFKSLRADQKTLTAFAVRVFLYENQQHEVYHMVEIDHEIEQQAEGNKVIGDPQLGVMEHPHERAENHHDHRRQHTLDAEPRR